MSTLRTIRLALLSAFRGADMLGVPSVAEQRQWPKWNTGLRFERLFAWLALPKTGADVFYFYHIIDLDRDGALADALHNVPSVRLITCRPRALDAARIRFHARSTEAYLVRAEEFRWKRFAGVDAAARETAHCPPHWMEGYRGALRWIHAGGPGHVYLVGAGGPGKVYCAAAKAAGSIGLDVGALFDGWCGLPTRPYLKPKDKVPCVDV
jgi:hypothetical protein